MEGDSLGRLVLVATPIGNLEDITLRALRVLGEVELVLAEDTRRTGVLLERHGIRAKLQSLHAHNEASRIDGVLELVRGGGSVALVTDAGMPLVSDPGERISAAIIEAGARVEVLPGASAVTTALALSGLPPVPFAFHGFPPRRAGERRSFFAALVERPETGIFFESPKRLAATLAELAEAFGPRQACVARELTKLHEEAARGTLVELAERFADGTRGEVTLVVAGAPEAAPMGDVEVDEAIRGRLADGLSPRDVAREVAVTTSRPRRDVYARVLALASSGGDDSET